MSEVSFDEAFTKDDTVNRYMFAYRLHLVS